MFKRPTAQQKSGGVVSIKPGMGFDGLRGGDRHLTVLYFLNTSFKAKFCHVVPLCFVISVWILRHNRNLPQAGHVYVISEKKNINIYIYIL